jgi:hypothetical protein
MEKHFSTHPNPIYLLRFFFVIRGRSPSDREQKLSCFSIKKKPGVRTDEDDLFMTN